MLKLIGQIVVTLLLVIVGVCYLSVVLAVLGIILALGVLLVLYWHITGVPFYIKKGDKVIGHYRRFRFYKSED